MVFLKRRANLGKLSDCLEPTSAFFLSRKLLYLLSGVVFFSYSSSFSSFAQPIDLETGTPATQENLNDSPAPPAAATAPSLSHTQGNSSPKNPPSSASRPEITLFPSALPNAPVSTARDVPSSLDIDLSQHANETADASSTTPAQSALPSSSEEETVLPAASSSPKAGSDPHIFTDALFNALPRVITSPTLRLLTEQIAEKVPYPHRALIELRIPQWDALSRLGAELQEKNLPVTLPPELLNPELWFALWMMGFTSAAEKIAQQGLSTSPKPYFWKRALVLHHVAKKDLDQARVAFGLLTEDAVKLDPFSQALYAKAIDKLEPPTRILPSSLDYDTIAVLAETKTDLASFGNDFFKAQGSFELKRFFTNTPSSYIHLAISGSVWNSFLLQCEHGEYAAIAGRIAPEALLAIFTSKAADTMEVDDLAALAQHLPLHAHYQKETKIDFAFLQNTFPNGLMGKPVNSDPFIRFSSEQALQPYMPLGVQGRVVGFQALQKATDNLQKAWLIRALLLAAQGLPQGPLPASKDPWLFPVYAKICEPFIESLFGSDLPIWFYELAVKVELLLNNQAAAQKWLTALQDKNLPIPQDLQEFVAFAIQDPLHTTLTRRPSVMLSLFQAALQNESKLPEFFTGHKEAHSGWDNACGTLAPHHVIALWQVSKHHPTAFLMALPAAVTAYECVLKGASPFILASFVRTLAQNGWREEAHRLALECMILTTRICP